MPLGIDRGVGAIKWSPLGWGRLTGKILRGHPLPAESRLHKTAAQAGGAELVTATAHDVNGHHRRPQ
jgi:aryl-alcohol dehydrogenase-like predicted oxidoreductase